MAGQVFCATRTHDGYVTSGPETFTAGRRREADAIFAGWRWSGDRLLIENDRWGVQPMFWSRTPTSVHVSPSIDALLAAGVPPDLDEGAMAVFLRTGFFVGEDTPFAAIRAVPPSSSLTWTTERLLVGGGWRYPRAAASDRRTAVERFAECFTAAVERCLQDATGPAAVLLSGGHDSRHILLAMHQLQRLPDCCVTVHPFPPAGSDDVAIAATLAQAVGVRHVILPQRRDRVTAEREKNVLTHYCADEHVQFLPLRSHFAGRDVHVFDGLAGDVLSQSQRLDASMHEDFVLGRFERVADRVLGQAALIEPSLSRLLTRFAAARFNRRVAIARVAAEAARHADAPNPIAGFFFFSRMRREIALAPYALLDGSRVSTPFLDDEVVDLLLSLPFGVVADRTLHTETLRRRYPAFAHLPFDVKRQGSGHASGVRRDAAALLSLMLESRSELVDTPSIVARALRAMASGVSRHLWFLPRIVHLLGVEGRARATLNR